MKVSRCAGMSMLAAVMAFAVSCGPADEPEPAPQEECEEGAEDCEEGPGLKPDDGAAILEAIDCPGEDC